MDVVKVTFDDTKGESVHNLCWMVPIKLVEDCRKSYNNMLELHDNLAMEYVLMLPRMADNGNTFTNYYYCIGHKWTERQRTGLFLKSPIQQEIFRDWILHMGGAEEFELL